ncbi:MAG: hypothetical protein IJ588_04205 [Prevotella sp.]|nr:hypothetical protein [Prevotella sp.]
MKKLTFVAVCAMAVMISCKNNGTANAGDGKDSPEAVLDSIIEEDDTTPPPMFIMSIDAQYGLMPYWSKLEEPQRNEEYPEYFEEEHRRWALQEMFRRNKEQYTNMLMGDRFVKIKFIDEVLKDPDGDTPSIGVIHGRIEIPSLCARFDFVNPSDKKESEYGGYEWGTVIVTDAYLQSRKHLPIKYFEYEWGEEDPLPAAVVKQLEERYGMTASRSELSCNIGDTYQYGLLQFEGEYKGNSRQTGQEAGDDRKHVLALDVLIQGDKVYVNEQIGDMFSETDYCWNVDDDGRYTGCYPQAAFEGPNGLELCYYRSAPESSTVGMFYLRNGKLIEHEYECYHNLVDEARPVWKRDLAEMDSLYHADEMGDSDVKLVKWAHVPIDYANEWIWLRDKDDKNGAFFLRKDGKLTLIAIENPRRSPLMCKKDDIGYLKLSGSAGGSSWQEEIHAFKDGKRLWRLNVLKDYGEIEEAGLNDKDITKEEAQAYLDQTPQGEQINAFFSDIEQ